MAPATLSYIYIVLVSAHLPMVSQVPVLRSQHTMASCSKLKCPARLCIACLRTLLRFTFIAILYAGIRC